MGRFESPGGADRMRRFARALSADPVETLLYLPEELSRHREHPVAYDVDTAWEEHLHDLLGAPWPCPEAPHAAELWGSVEQELHDRGLAFGRHTYGGYSDADESLARAVRCVVLHRHAEVVVETGVARGVISRYVLEALEQNGRGHLWSIDLPHPFRPGLHPETGAAVPTRQRRAWSYIEGSSRRRLPRLGRQLGRVDVFVHDSLHTARNTRFEMDRIGRILAPDGVMLIDDISTHQGFALWTRAATGVTSLVCPSADGEGLFGVVCASGA
ncbi:class I SAM-dependent methyltransferase [Kitasatospora sp. NPDC048540]|uniref:class I SAM-dependent methyltransferase n=1 Tax=unclassified Kitasatospora TaxID=2633591 RepID=UPI00068D58CA|nr:class I SAM-dependent methyltransferase [Kitasatospora sp. MBT63]